MISPALLGVIASSRRASAVAVSFDPTHKDATITLTNSNKTASVSTNVAANVWSTTGVTDKRYFEFMKDVSGPSVALAVTSTRPLSSGSFTGTSTLVCFDDGGALHDNSGGSSSIGSAWAVGDVIMVAVDATAGKVYFGRNGAWLGSANPSAGTGAQITFAGGASTYYVGAEFNTTPGGAQATGRFIGSELKYPMPTAYTSWDGTSYVYVPPLDSYTTSLWIACSLNRLLTSYTGSLVRVRRSSDSTEQDIGYVNGGYNLDTVSLLAFCGAGDGFISKWYDQSGAANDIPQTTTTKQTKIVASGVYLGTSRWDGTSSVVATPNLPNCTGASVFMKGNAPLPTSGTHIWFEMYQGVSTDRFTNYFAGASAWEQAVVNASTGQASSKGGQMSNEAIGWRFDRTQSTGPNGCISFVHGGALGGLSADSTNSGLPLSGNYANIPISIGGRLISGTGSLWTTMDAQTMVFYTVALTDANMINVQKAIDQRLLPP